MLFRRKKSIDEASEALREARRHVEEAKARDHEVKTIAHKAKHFRERNHISEQVDEIIWGHLGG